MKRERATRMLADMITRLEDGAWPLGLVEEVYVFGSYARGALEPNDVDVVIPRPTVCLPEAAESCSPIRTSNP